MITSTHMQPSPLQLRALKFIDTRVDSRIPPSLDKFGEDYPDYEFKSTTIISTIEHSPAEDSEDSPIINFLVALRIELPDDGDIPPPYIIDVKCVGYFTLLKDAFPDPIKRYDVAVVNGTSMLYGAIRERVSELTSRSWYGNLLLPSANFQKDAPSNGGHKLIDNDEVKIEKIFPTKKRQPKKTTK